MEETIEWRLRRLENEASRNFKTVEDMDHVLNGNGQPGLIVEMRNFMAEQRGATKERAKQIDNLKWFLGIIIALMTGILGWLGYLQIHGTTKAILNVGDSAKQMAVESQQHAGAPVDPYREAK